jgi:hypothetical protein
MADAQDNKQRPDQSPGVWNCAPRITSHTRSGTAVLAVEYAAVSGVLTALN